MEAKAIQVSAPGRICLLGEHQDYFGLPVIAAAINLRINISGRTRPDLKFEIGLPDVDGSEKIDLNSEVTYSRKRDYLKSAINVLRREGVTFLQGWDCTVKGAIPINSGTSSSSALVVAWVKFLLEGVAKSDQNVPHIIAELAYRAEVEEFNEPGGKMDHYASALGGVVNIHFEREMSVHKFKNPLKEFVLADSLIKKDTTGTLAHIKKNVLAGVALIQKRIKEFRLNGDIGQREREEIERLPDENRRFVEGTLKTRELVEQGERLFRTAQFDHEQFGQLLINQQAVLRDYLAVSSPKLEGMIEVSLEHGALGAKINGSGQGGCIFAYCPDRASQVAEALSNIGAKTYIIHVDEGVRREV